MKNKEASLELFIYMITSAAGLENEPHIYGSLRLIEASQRLCQLRLEDDPDNQDLKDLISIIEEGKHKCTSDEPAFYQMLQDAAAKLVDII